MTWSDLIQHASQFSPNADVYLSIDLPSYVARQNWPLTGIRSEGQLVFLDGMAEERESNP